MRATRGHLRIRRGWVRHGEVLSVRLEVGRWTHSWTHGFDPEADLDGRGPLDSGGLNAPLVAAPPGPGQVW